MQRIIFICAFLLCCGKVSYAEELMFDYFTLLGPRDAFNSAGKPHQDLCTITQQDRANWHRFKKREQTDGPDPFFINTERRAMIAGKCQYDHDYFANAGDRIRNGSRYFFVYVRVFGANGNVSRVLITEGAG